MFFWITLPEGVDAEALLPRAVERGVAFVPGAPFFAGAAMKNTLRLSYVTVPPEAIARGVRALAAALETMP
jgi:2-aminoadipate transaminase